MTIVGGWQVRIRVDASIHALSSSCLLFLFLFLITNTIQEMVESQNAIIPEKRNCAGFEENIVLGNQSDNRYWFLSSL